jgi:hypothetical protein
VINADCGLLGAITGVSIIQAQDKDVTYTTFYTCNNHGHTLQWVVNGNQLEKRLLNISEEKYGKWDNFLKDGKTKK